MRECSDRDFIKYNIKAPKWKSTYNLCADNFDNFFVSKDLDKDGFSYV